ncbi:MAG: hypothetical protein EA376_01920 [Phycisphaeraceae bacterium]|nr:MAG: hypothetical protein EA376_01920 [Phycisphaeraceae bacterium]
MLYSSVTIEINEEDEKALAEIRRVFRLAKKGQKISLALPLIQILTSSSVVGQTYTIVSTDWKNWAEVLKSDVFSKLACRTAHDIAVMRILDNVSGDRLRFWQQLADSFGKC